VVDLEPTITALRAAMVAALPELGANGVYEAEHADLVPWADFALPYGVILIDEVPRDEAGPLDETWLRPRVQLYYVMSVSGDSVGLRAKLQTLRAALWPTDPLAAANAGQIVSEVGYRPTRYSGGTACSAAPGGSSSTCWWPARERPRSRRAPAGE
jgi:hypothetical protein